MRIYALALELRASELADLLSVVREHQPDHWRVDVATLTTWPPS